MTLQQILIALVTAFVPLFHMFITNKYPDFPFSGSQTLELFIWVINGLIFGANAAYTFIAEKVRKRGNANVGEFIVSKSGQNKKGIFS